jgi:iron(III) transport system substrate-binding protein
MAARMVDADRKGLSMKSTLKLAMLMTAAALCAAPGATLAVANEVNVYTYREAGLVKPLFDAFTKETGIKVNVISASSGLEQRIKSEGANSPADVLLTVDISRLEDAVQAGITQPLNSKAVDAVVPAAYRDPEGHWAGVGMRARIFYVSKDRVKQTAFTYEELADPKWKAEEWLKGLKANLAQKPSGGDRETARDIAAGKCDLGVANTYYWALMNDKETDRKPWAEATKVVLPSFQGGGTHVNLSGVVLIKTAPNKANAVKFIEWMVSPAAQQMHADVTYEYPMRAGVPVNKTIAGYGELKRDPIALSQIAANRKKASALVDKVGFDN